MKKYYSSLLVMFFLFPFLTNTQYHPQRITGLLESPAQIQQNSPTGTCHWKGNEYDAGEHFCNDAMQEWVCNEDGTYSYTGNSGPDVCPNHEAHCIWNGQSYAAGEKFCNAANQEWVCNEDGSYSYTGNSGESSCPASSRYCSWDGNLYNPGEYFCNAADQQWLCNAGGTYVYTGKSGEEYCSQGAVLCTWNGKTYKTGESLCDSACQQWVCQSSGTFIYTGYSGSDVCPNCNLPTATAMVPTITPVVTSSGCQISYNTAYESEVLTLINRLRTEFNLPPLSMNDQLNAAARVHSQDMACKNFFSHSGSDGMSPYDRISAQGYSYSSAGENIAGGNSSPQTIVDGWYNSDGHRRNMLSENYTQIGVGYIYNSYSTYGGYWTTNFGKPK